MLRQAHYGLLDLGNVPKIHFFLQSSLCRLLARVGLEAKRVNRFGARYTELIAERQSTEEHATS
jgi:hypothetical protein